MTTTKDRCRARDRESCPKHGNKPSSGMVKSPRSFEEFLTIHAIEDETDDGLRSKLISKVSAATNLPAGHKLALLATLSDLKGDSLQTWESDCAVRDELDGYEADWKEMDPNIQFEVDVVRGDKLFHVELLYLPPKMRKQGFGSKMLQQISSTADKHGYNVTLEPDDGFGTPVLTLAKIYGAYGFQWKNGKTMVRFPR